MISEERAEHLRDLSQTAEQGDTPEFGKVSFIAFNASKNMFAMYADSDASGNVIVCMSNLSAELNRQ